MLFFSIAWTGTEKNKQKKITIDKNYQWKLFHKMKSAVFGWNTLYQWLISFLIAIFGGKLYSVECKPKANIHGNFIPFLSSIKYVCHHKNDTQSNWDCTWNYFKQKMTTAVPTTTSVIKYMICTVYSLSSLSISFYLFLHFYYYEQMAVSISEREKKLPFKYLIWIPTNHGKLKHAFNNSTVAPAENTRRFYICNR